MEIAIALAVLYALVERVLGRKDVQQLLTRVIDVVDKAREREESLLAEFARERGELLLRLQHPEVIVPPRTTVDSPAAAEPEADEWDRVGLAVLAADAEVDPRAEGGS